ncbi:MAG TPA: sulfite exporter TauE/SafE family protein [Chryseolinea sp.]|nr:sulfite exporter TauE/SafE family protein [Chryseolinea sp.]
MDALIGYAVISLMGVCLGMIGAGGSILAVPVLVYLFRIEPTLATAYASIIVGIAAATGAVRSLQTRSIDLRSMVWFGVPCIIGAYLARFCLVALIPDVMVSQPSFVLTRDAFVMLLFSATMLLAGCSMLSRRNHGPVQVVGDGRLLPVGMLVGIVTGFAGAGGGFLILPSLVLVAGLDVPLAVGTSLPIIAVKSIVSMLGDLSGGVQIDLLLVGSLTAVAIPSVMAGRWLNGYVKAAALKTGFGVIICLACLLMCIHQVVIIVRGH